MSLQDLKAKIETFYKKQQSTAQLSGITDDDFELYFTNQIDGSFQFVTTTLETSWWGLIMGDDPQPTNTTVNISYKKGFEKAVEQNIRNKGYQNLTYNEVRLGVSAFDENNQSFKKVVENLNNEILGPALDEFSFSQFDSQVSTAVNDLFKRGGTIEYDNVLPFVRNRGAINVDGTPVNDYVVQGELEYVYTTFSLKPDTWDSLKQTYLSENGSDLESSSGRVLLDSDLQLQGNASRITNEFKLDRVNAGGAGLLDAIIDIFTDYTSPSAIINTRYKNFLVESLKDPVNIEKNFSRTKDEAADDLVYYLVYDFEYERRINIGEVANLLGIDATAEDILGAAESAALDSLAASGLAGEGGISTELSPEEIEERQRFFEQCALLATMDEFRDIFTNVIREEGQIDSGDTPPDEAPAPSGEKMHQPSPYQERFYMVEVPSGRNDRLVNFLHAPSTDPVNDFLNLTPDIQSFLAPKLRLYKVFNEGDKLKQVEFIFKNSTDKTSLLKQMFNDNDKFFRGSGYGIKSFSFSFNGTTPATAKNDITADLTLYFQDFSDFVTPVKTSQGTFKFVDLIFYDKQNVVFQDVAPTNNQSYGYGNSHPDQYSPAYYRIRADVGWHVPKDQPQFDDACRKRNLNPDNVRDVIEKTNKSFYLNMTDHELDFKKDGTIEIKAKYHGYIESVLKGSTMDALTDKLIIKDRKDRQERLETAKRTCTPGELARIKRIYAAEELVIIQDLYQRTYQRLNDLNKVRVFRVEGGNDGGFRKNGYFSSKPSLVDVPTESNAGQIDDEHAYYFLGDLLYVMLDSLYADNEIAEPIGKTKLILPTIEFEDFFTDGSGFAINIAQIPISHRYFSEWWAEHVIKAKKRSYPIMFYLRDILNNLVADALIDTCLNRNYNKSFNFQTTTINASEDPLSNTANSSDPIITLDQSKLPFIVSEDTDINDITNYVLVFPAHSTLLPSGVGKYTEDLETGVYHFNLGQDRGLVNDVKFNKVDMAYMPEARFQREGVDGLLQLGSVYRASMNMFGNTLFYPGMLIYINPFGIGGQEFLPNKEGTIANQLGLGGYHIIEKVNSTIGGGMFKTSVEAMFVYSGDGDTRIKIQARQKESDEDNVEQPKTEPPTCVALVSTVRADYLNTLAGQETDLAEQASVEANAENLRNTLSNAGATDIPPPEAPLEASTTGIPDTGINLGFSVQDLLRNNQESDSEGSPDIPSFGFNLNSLLNTGGDD